MVTGKQKTEIVIVGRVIFVSWAPRPSEADVDRVLAEMKRVHERLGTKSVYLAVVPADAANPSGEERDALGRLAKSARLDCDSMHVVIEGTGLKKSLQRGVVSGFMLVLRQRGYINIHETIDEALAAIAKTGPVERERLLNEIRPLLSL